MTLVPVTAAAVVSVVKAFRNGRLVADVHHEVTGSSPDPDQSTVRDSLTRIELTTATTAKKVSGDA